MLFGIKLGIPYFHWTRDLSLVDHSLFDEDSIEAGCLLLPFLSPATGNVFTAVDNHHRYIGLDRKLEHKGTSFES